MPELPGRRGGPSPSSSRHRPDTRESRDRRHNSRPITGHERRSSESPGRKRRRSFEESRRRSASPDGAARDSSRHRHRPRRRRHSSRERRGDSKPKDCEPRWDLPYSARSLGKADLATFEPLFIHYLAVQKQREARDMDEREFRGRWRSFIGKWNRGELAEGWYDPDMFSRISSWVAEDDEGSDPDGARGERGPEVTSGRGSNNDYNDDDDDDDDDADDYGPTLPQKQAATRRRVGAEIPTAQDLSLRDELILEDREEEREALRAARRADRTLQRERLEELAATRSRSSSGSSCGSGARSRSANCAARSSTGPSAR
ncbi:hypothetical protein HIM_07421 [Hirsutella minnesotensis 3608]|uniref:Uncharacterized protein n=1 Tax=Hirsutella minnesotensis 3608 TaxID=1043627 RepID=A0A0F8A4A2_9HYPO|nr:hypothetical protein HIM_07421 [Hirsutella minnesotensis 3608]